MKYRRGGAVYIHPTLAEGFFALMEDVKPSNETTGPVAT